MEGEIEMDKQEKIRILQDMIRINSENGNEEEVALYLKKLLENNDISSTLVPYEKGRSNLIAEISNDNGKVLAYSGHMDVVAAGDASKWLFPPFEAHIDGNKLYGRGSTDMKSGLAAMSISLIELKKLGLPKKGKLKLIATVGEEIGELGAKQLTKEGYVDDIDALVIGEPTNYNLMYTHNGSIDYTVVSHGKSAHSSMPQLGINAIHHLNKFIDKVQADMQKVIETYENKVLGRTIHNITLIKGGTQVNSIPDRASLEGNIRTIPEFDNDNIIELLNKIIQELNKQEFYELDLKIDYNKLPVCANKNSELIQTIQQQFKKKLPLVCSAGTTDAAEFIQSNKNFDFVIFGPGVSKTAHQINEYVEIDNYLDMVDKYIEIAKTYLQ